MGRFVGSEGELKIEAGNPGVLTRKGLRTCSFAVLDGLYDRAMLLGRNVGRGLDLLGVRSTENQSFGRGERYSANMFQLPKESVTLREPPQLAMKVFVRFQI